LIVNKLSQCFKLLPKRIKEIHKETKLRPYILPKKKITIQGTDTVAIEVMAPSAKPNNKIKSSVNIWSQPSYEKILKQHRILKETVEKLMVLLQVKESEDNIVYPNSTVLERIDNRWCYVVRPTNTYTHICKFKFAQNARSFS
jgi:hypothetical protein